MSNRLKMFALMAGACALLACQPPATTKSAGEKNPGGDKVTGADSGLLLADFEKSDDSVTWEPLVAVTHLPAANAATQAAEIGAAPAMMRSSARPQAGLWSISARLDAAGEVRRTSTLVDLNTYDVVSAQVMHTGAASRSGAATATIALTDADGKRFESDAFPVTAAWRDIELDLGLARDEGLDTSRLTAMAVVFRPVSGSARETTTETAPAPLTVQTDSWKAHKRQHTYIGTEGNKGSLFVETHGRQIRVVMPSAEITLFNRGAKPDGTAPLPWMEVRSGKSSRRLVGGALPNGLMLLDAAGYASLTDFRETGPDDDTSKAVSGVHPGWQLPTTSWPASIMPALTQISWEVVWNSPAAAIIEGHQENGPYDRLGEPAVTAKWRLMIYAHGQIYAHVEWSTASDITVPEPITWALALEDNRRGRGVSLDPPADKGQQQLLETIYPAPIRQGLATALPHRMQSDAPVAMVARTNAQKNTWWWASGKLSETSPDFRRYFGAAIVSSQGEAGRKRADCMLMVNEPDVLHEAASFAQYLVPPKVIARQGELDLTYPGDADGDGFVESYGFQAIRLANGRATFTIYPQGRPVFFPTFLFTVPAAEWTALDLKHSRLLVTVDGKLFNDPPQFPDGGFLLQLPTEIDQPVSVEAIVVKQ